MYDPDDFFGRKRKNHTGVIPPLNRCASSIFVEDTNVPSKKQTNADRIRAMSDEELAEYLSTMQAHAYYHGMYHGKKSDETEWLEWLQQEESE